MTAYCIAGTFVPDAATAHLSERVARSLAAYRHDLGQTPETETLCVARHGMGVDWGALWQQFSEAVLKELPALVAYNGSLGDAVTPETTVANWARDWQMPLLLLVPVDDVDMAIAQAAAFVGLARHARAKIAGAILWGAQEPDELDWELTTERLQILTQVPAIGYWRVGREEGDRDTPAKAVSGFAWERLAL
ncbi:MAG: hypothetical protein AAFX40_17000 [Cyanobacteria bacterium J06639_1]